jgi:L-alanine-DL-glutamate epimerase-like enolase superfamily enzyme
MPHDPVISRLIANAYTIPADTPESDGTLEWNETTIVLARAVSGDTMGIGYSYTHGSAALVIAKKLARVVCGRSAMDVGGAWRAMIRSIRDFGDTGIGAMAVAAVDAALWDCKARLLGIPLATLLGPRRRAVPACASGGFASYSDKQLCQQLARRVTEGFRMVKMKIGRDPDADRRRVREAREAVGGQTRLSVDANGAYGGKQALWMATTLAEEDVRQYEEPVSHRDVAGLRMIRERASKRLEIAAGKYGFELDYFRRLLEAQALDALRADATRCGPTAFTELNALCAAFHIPLSSHAAPSLHLHFCCAAPAVTHMDYYHDHALIEHKLFDGAARPDGKGCIAPDWDRPGNGLLFKEKDAAPYEIRF